MESLIAKAPVDFKNCLGKNSVRCATCLPCTEQTLSVCTQRVLELIPPPFSGITLPLTRMREEFSLQPFKSPLIFLIFHLGKKESCIYKGLIHGRTGHCPESLQNMYFGRSQQLGIRQIPSAGFCLEKLCCPVA